MLYRFDPYSLKHQTKVGFQGKDPSTDFRGGGELALRNLLWFVETQPTIALAMMRKRRRPDNATAGMVVLSEGAS
jgi:hypothetical protein